MNELFYSSIVEEIQLYMNDLQNSLGTFSSASALQKETIVTDIIPDVQSIKLKTETLAFHFEELEHKLNTYLESSSRYQSAPSVYSVQNLALSTSREIDEDLNDHDDSSSTYKTYSTSTDTSPNEAKTTQVYNISSDDEEAFFDQYKGIKEELSGGVEKNPLINELSEWDKLFLQLRSDLVPKNKENNNENNEDDEIVITQEDNDNENYQNMLKGVFQLENNFFAAASTISQMIVAEQHCDEQQKKIRPVDVGGKAGGTKFSLHGLFFKYPVDSPIDKDGKQWLYGGKEQDNDSAVKASNNDMKGLTYCMLEDQQQFLSFPLMALIDFQGFRMSVMTSLPLRTNSLVYGSNDAGHTVKQDPTVHNYLKELGSKLNLRTHNVSSQGVEMALCGDVEIHQIDHEQEKLYYALDLARVFPPSWTLTDSPQGSIFYRMLRPELIKQFEKPLCSDALSGWLTDKNKYEMNLDIHRATDLLLTNITKFAKDIISESNREKYIDAYYFVPQQPIFDGLPVKQVLLKDMQLRGINLRYLGKLLLDVKDLDPQHPIINVLFSIMVTRAMKNVWRSKIRGSREKGPKNRIYDICQEFSLSCINFCLMINKPEKLQSPINKYLQKKFESMYIKGVLDSLQQPQLQNFFSSQLKQVYVPSLIINFCQLNGIVLNPRCVHYLSGNIDFKFNHPDIVSFVPVVKCSPILDIFSGLYLYFTACKEKYAFSRLNLMKSAFTKLDSVVNTYFPKVGYYLSEAQFEIMKLDKNSFVDWDIIIKHFSTKWDEIGKSETSKVCWDYLHTLLWKILRGSTPTTTTTTGSTTTTAAGLHPSIISHEVFPFYYITDSMEPAMDDITLLINPKATISKDGDINLIPTKREMASSMIEIDTDILLDTSQNINKSNEDISVDILKEEEISMLELIDRDVLLELDGVKYSISKALCKLLPDDKYLQFGPLKIDRLESSVILQLINEAKDWDIDIKQKCAFFMHYFSLTDLLELCDQEHIVPIDKDGQFLLAYYPHVLALSERKPAHCLDLLLKLNIKDKSSLNALLCPNCDGETVLTNAIKKIDKNFVECLVNLTKGVALKVMTNKAPLLIALQKLEQIDSNNQIDYLTMIDIIQILIASDFGFPTYDDFKNTLINESLLHDITVNDVSREKLKKEIEKYVYLIVEDRATTVIENCLKFNIINLNVQDKLGNAAIHFAARNGDIDTLKLLLKSDCDVNLRNNFGDSALHIAVEEGHEEAVKILIQHKKCDLNILNNYGCSAVVYAANKSVEILQLFLQNGSDPNSTNKGGQSLLHIAIQNNNYEMVELLISFKCSLKQKNEYGETPLYCAVYIGEKQLIESLLKAGASKNEKNEDGVTPLQKSEEKDPSIKELLDLY